LKLVFEAVTRGASGAMLPAPRAKGKARAATAVD